MALQINRLSAVMGAEVVGADASSPLDSETIRAIEGALNDHLVVVLRNQNLSPAAQVSFSRCFGDLEIQGNSRYAVEGFPNVLIISNDMRDGEPIGVIDAGDYWHSDSSHKETPSKATILHSKKNPSTGGDTLFADMYRAYETLPEATKQRIANLRGLHASSKLKNRRVAVSVDRPGAVDFYSSRNDRPDVAHPIARTHPATGRKALYISPRFTIGIEGLDDDEAQDLLDELFEHQLKPEFQYRHQWLAGDLVMWDNRCLVHSATGGYKYPDVRLMHRTVIMGDRPK